MNNSDAGRFEVSEHLNRQIPPQPHTAMYVWHKYWSRKTWNVVGEFIETYSRPGEVVFDPFAGSGVVGIEAIRHGRRAIICDLNPAASEIADLTIRPVDIAQLEAAFKRIEGNVKAKIESLYVIHCVECKAALVCDTFVREGDKLTEVRYQQCPECGYRAEHDKPRREDVESLSQLEAKAIVGWHPTNPLKYSDGSPFQECQRFESIDELFTWRNLQGLAWLREAIQQEKFALLRRFLMGAFTSMVHLCSRMMPVGNPQETNHYTFFSSPGWTQHSYWSAGRYMEQGVWEKFRSAVIGHQGLLNAKRESQRILGSPRITNDWRKVLSGQADIAVVTGDSLALMEPIA
jgi:DNA-directed RNA polymerase subunit RPC12/RpoP